VQHRPKFITTCSMRLHGVNAGSREVTEVMKYSLLHVQREIKCEYPVFIIQIHITWTNGILT
jgi:hypothetical protein